MLLGICNIRDSFCPITLLFSDTSRGSSLLHSLLLLSLESWNVLVGVGDIA